MLKRRDEVVDEAEDPNPGRGRRGRGRGRGKGRGRGRGRGEVCGRRIRGKTPCKEGGSLHGWDASDENAWDENWADDENWYWDDWTMKWYWVGVDEDHQPEEAAQPKVAKGTPDGKRRRKIGKPAKKVRDEDEPEQEAQQKPEKSFRKASPHPSQRPNMLCGWVSGKRSTTRLPCM